MRIAGVTISDKKRLEIALTGVYGIGRARAKVVLNDTKVDYGKKAGDLSKEEEGAIRKSIESYVIEGDLKRTIAQNIRRLRDIKSYKGTRHLKRLPVSGQRTKTNSRTVRGNVRKTMGSGKRKVDKK